METSFPWPHQGRGLRWHGGGSSRDKWTLLTNGGVAVNPALANEGSTSAGGAAVGQTAGGAVPSATSVGTFRLTFTASDNATLRLPDGTTRTLARFRF